MLIISPKKSAVLGNEGGGGGAYCQSVCCHVSFSCAFSPYIFGFYSFASVHHESGF